MKAFFETYQITNTPKKTSYHYRIENYSMQKTKNWAIIHI